MASNFQTIVYTSETLCRIFMTRRRKWRPGTLNFRHWSFSENFLCSTSQVLSYPLGLHTEKASKEGVFRSWTTLLMTKKINQCFIKGWVLSATPSVDFHATVQRNKANLILQGNGLQQLWLALYPRRDLINQGVYFSCCLSVSLNFLCFPIFHFCFFFYFSFLFLFFISCLLSIPSLNCSVLPGLTQDI